MKTEEIKAIIAYLSNSDGTTPDTQTEPTLPEINESNCSKDELLKIFTDAFKDASWDPDTDPTLYNPTALKCARKMQAFLKKATPQLQEEIKYLFLYYAYEARNEKIGRAALDILAKA